MATRINTTSDEARIRALIDDWLRAVRAQDIDGIMACYAPDIVAYDAVSQLRFTGAEAYRAHWQACLAMCPGPMTFAMRDLDLAAGGDVAFGHSLIRCGATGADGEEKASWMRMTAGYRKREGRWMVVHEHFSAPFDIESGLALFDLRP